MSKPEFDANQVAACERLGTKAATEYGSFPYPAYAGFAEGTIHDILLMLGHNDIEGAIHAANRAVAFLKGARDAS